MKKFGVKRMNINHLTRWKTQFFGKEAEEAEEEGVLNIPISSRKLLELLSNVSVSFCALFSPVPNVSTVNQLTFSVSPLSHLPKICDPISENVI